MDVISKTVARKCCECGRTVNVSLVGRDDEVINDMPDDGAFTCSLCEFKEKTDACVPFGRS